MNDDYLWDRSGEPDPAVQALERRLAPLRARLAPRPAARRASRTLWFAAAAALLAAPLWFLHPAQPDAAAPAPAEHYFAAEVLEGSAGVILNARAKSSGFLSLAAGERKDLPTGSLLECAAGARVRLQVADLGDVTFEGPGRLFLSEANPQLQRLALEHGLVRASISARAKPRLFQVETPGGTAVDMGCQYSMRVRDDLATELHVYLGRVHFEIGDEPIYVRSGSSCVVRNEGKGGPIAGTPFNDGSPEALRAAIDHYDSAADASERERAAADVAGAAREEDAVSIWHMLKREPSVALRGRLFDALTRLSPPPAAAARARCVDGSGAVRDAALEEWRVDLMGW